MTSTTEFAVQISCDTCVKKIDDSLKNVEGIKNFKILKDEGTVLVESNLPSTMIQEKIESTGRKAVLKGCGGDEGKEEDVYNFVKIDVDEFGFCAICKPEPNSKLLDVDKSSGFNVEKSEIANLKCQEEAQQDEDKSIGNCNESGNQPVSKRKKSKNGVKSDDDEELELKYSSDSDNEGGSVKGGDIWKIEDELEADFDVIDEDDDDQKDENIERDNDKCNSPSSKRKMDGEDAEDIFDPDFDIEKHIEMQQRPGKRFIKELKSCKIRKGDFNLNNFHLALQVIILPQNEGELVEATEAQHIKDSLLRELFLKARDVRSRVAESFPLKFSDCKLVNPGWLLIQCENKETFGWLLNWDIPPLENKLFQSIPALDKTPLQKIKFQIKTKMVLDDDIMLKLIHLQNRNIDIRRWILEEKKSISNGVEQYTYKVDYGTIYILEKQDWTFFYELFTVKVSELNGAPVNYRKGIDKINQVRAAT